MGVAEQYRGETLTHAVLQRRRLEAEQRRAQAFDQVDTLATTHKALGEKLGEEVGTLEQQEVALQRVKQAEAETGIIAALVRPFTARRNAVARRSFTEGLLTQYERVSTRLREASRFGDELHLCTLELQQELDRLHRDMADASHNQSVARERIAAARAALDALDEDASLDPAERERLRDRYTFDLRTEMIALQLHTTAAEQCKQHLEPARALRDTVLRLHEQMATYVLQATHTVDAAGRRIQGLGMLADAPAVVAELQESIDELHAAMDATQHYIDQSRRFLADVLPELRARIELESEAEADRLTERLRWIDSAAQRMSDEEARQLAAVAEVEEFLAGESG